MKKTWLLGFGFFSISLTWALYNAFVPLFLEDFIESAMVIGFLMTLDNYLALFVQPWIGNRSDRTDTRFGRRMPYLMIGMPLAAIFMSMIPLYTSLITLVLFMFLMNISMSLYRSPTVALMPDITPDAQRSKANGIINFMGGIGTVAAFGVGSIMYDVNRNLPFMAAGLLTLLALFIVSRSIKEKRDTISYTVSEKKQVRMRGELDRTTVFLLLAIFFWFLSYQGVEAMFTLYGTLHLGLTDGEASFLLTFFSLAFLIFALPSGYLGTKFGKKKMIMIGVAGLMGVFAVVPFLESLALLRVALIIGGVFWACININSYPFVVSTGRERSIGTRTGMYYLVSSLAAIISPPLVGQIIDWTDYSMLFVYAAGMMLLALVCVLNVRHSGKSVEQGMSVTP